MTGKRQAKAASKKGRSALNAVIKRVNEMLKDTEAVLKPGEANARLAHTHATLKATADAELVSIDALRVDLQSSGQRAASFSAAALASLQQAKNAMEQSKKSAALEEMMAKMDAAVKAGVDALKRSKKKKMKRNAASGPFSSAPKSKRKKQVSFGF